MKRALAILLLTASTAQAEPRHVWLPPVQYDKPYAGKLITIRVKTSAEIREACPTLKFAFGYDAACSRRWDNPVMCAVIMLEDAELIARGFRPDHVLRHEIGHCNGWAGNHAGAIDPR